MNPNVHLGHFGEKLSISMSYSLLCHLQQKGNLTNSFRHSSISFLIIFLNIYIIRLFTKPAHHLTTLKHQEPNQEFTQNGLETIVRPKMQQWTMHEKHGW